MERPSPHEWAARICCHRIYPREATGCKPLLEAPGCASACRAMRSSATFPPLQLRIDKLKAQRWFTEVLEHGALLALLAYDSWAHPPSCHRPVMSLVRDLGHAVERAPSLSAASESSLFAARMNLRRRGVHLYVSQYPRAGGTEFELVSSWRYLVVPGC